MKYSLALIKRSLKKVFTNKNYFWLFSSLTVLFLGFFLLFPVFAIVENNILLQITFMRWFDFLFIIILSGLFSLLITLQVFSFRNKAKTHMGKTTLGGVSGILAGIVATATCPACLIGVLGFLGAGNIIFLMKYKTLAVVFSSLILVIAIYFSLRTVSKCKGSC